ncbi:hypothetical protein C0J52_27211 [Blattella germanica]|nr:hypothetical protein C0J52_27211 [Blattella germanica]
MRAFKKWFILYKRDQTLSSFTAMKIDVLVEQLKHLTKFLDTGSVCNKKDQQPRVLDEGAQVDIIANFTMDPNTKFVQKLKMSRRRTAAFRNVNYQKIQDDDHDFVDSQIEQISWFPLSSPDGGPCDWLSFSIFFSLPVLFALVFCCLNVTSGESLRFWGYVRPVPHVYI